MQSVADFIHDFETKYTRALIAAKLAALSAHCLQQNRISSERAKWSDCSKIGAVRDKMQMSATM